MSGILFVMHSAITIISPLFYSTMMASQVPWAGSLTNLHTYRIAYRYALSIYMAVDLQLKYSAIIGIISVIPLALYAYKSAGVQLFYSKIVYFIETLIVWTFLSLSLIHI